MTTPRSTPAEIKIDTAERYKKFLTEPPQLIHPTVADSISKFMHEAKVTLFSQEVALDLAKALHQFELLNIDPRNIKNANSFIPAPPVDTTEFKANVQKAMSKLEVKLDKPFHRLVDQIIHHGEQSPILISLTDSFLNKYKHQKKDEATLQAEVDTIEKQMQQIFKTLEDDSLKVFKVKKIDDLNKRTGEIKKEIDKLELEKKEQSSATPSKRLEEIDEAIYLSKAQYQTMIKTLEFLPNINKESKKLQGHTFSDETLMVLSRLVDAEDRRIGFAFNEYSAHQKQSVELQQLQDIHNALSTHLKETYEQLRIKIDPLLAQLKEAKNYYAISAYKRTKQGEKLLNKLSLDPIAEVVLIKILELRYFLVQQYRSRLKIPDGVPIELALETYKEINPFTLFIVKNFNDVKSALMSMPDDKSVEEAKSIVIKLQEEWDGINKVNKHSLPLSNVIRNLSQMLGKFGSIVDRSQDRFFTHLECVTEKKFTGSDEQKRYTEEGVKKIKEDFKGKMIDELEYHTDLTELVLFNKLSKLIAIVGATTPPLSTFLTALNEDKLPKEFKLSGDLQERLREHLSTQSNTPQPKEPPSSQPFLEEWKAILEDLKNLDYRRAKLEKTHNLEDFLKLATLILNVVKENVDHLSVFEDLNVTLKEINLLKQDLVTTLQAGNLTELAALMSDVPQAAKIKTASPPSQPDKGDQKTVAPGPALAPEKKTSSLSVFSRLLKSGISAGAPKIGVTQTPPEPPKSSPGSAREAEIKISLTPTPSSAASDSPGFSSTARWMTVGGDSSPSPSPQVVGKGEDKSPAPPKAGSHLNVPSAHNVKYHPRRPSQGGSPSPSSGPASSPSGSPSPTEAGSRDAPTHSSPGPRRG